MSRVVFSNQDYSMAFGVDHTPMGTFFQIWDRSRKQPSISEGHEPEEYEDDQPSINVDSLYGIRIHHPEILAKNKSLARQMKDLQGAWNLCASQGIERPNLQEEDIIDIARALGLDTDKVSSEAYRLWD